MSDLQPYIAKVDDWVTYYANADRKKQNGGIGGSVGAPSGETASRVETKPQPTSSTPTSISVLPTISVTQGIVDQSASVLKRAHRMYKKRVHTVIKKKSKKTKKTKKTKKAKKSKKKRPNSVKHKKKKRGKKKIKISTKRITKKVGLKKKKRTNRAGKSKKISERELYPTVI